MTIFEDLLQQAWLFDISPHLVASAVIIASAILMFVAVRSVRSVWLAASIPVALVIIATLVFTIHNIGGQPAERMPRGEFEFLSYDVVGTKKEWMYLWIIEFPDDNRLPVTLKVPYSEDGESELDKGERAVNAGRSVRGEMTGGLFELHAFNRLDLFSESLKDITRQEQIRAEEQYRIQTEANKIGP